MFYNIFVLGFKFLSYIILFTHHCSGQHPNKYEHASNLHLNKYILYFSYLHEFSNSKV